MDRRNVRSQIALLVGPVLVLVSFALGQPMTLLFHPLEIAGITLSVLATAIVSPDGESNWWKGCNCSPSMWSWSSRST